MSEQPKQPTEQELDEAARLDWERERDGRVRAEVGMGQEPKIEDTKKELTEDEKLTILGALGAYIDSETETSDLRKRVEIIIKKIEAGIE